MARFAEKDITCIKWDMAVQRLAEASGNPVNPTRCRDIYLQKVLTGF